MLANVMLRCWCNSRGKGKATRFTHLVGQGVSTEVLQRKLEFSVLIFAADDDLNRDGHVRGRCRGGGSHRQLILGGAGEWRSSKNWRKE